jgi:hypothetical protein
MEISWWTMALTFLASGVKAVVRLGQAEGGEAEVDLEAGGDGTC